MADFKNSLEFWLIKLRVSNKENIESISKVRYSHDKLELKDEQVRKEITGYQVQLDNLEQ